MTGRRKRLSFLIFLRVRGYKGSVKQVLRSFWELSLVQILVIVASIQMGSLKTDVEKGSARTVIGRRLVGPKR